MIFMIIYLVIKQFSSKISYLSRQFWNSGCINYDIVEGIFIELFNFQTIDNIVDNEVSIKNWQPKVSVQRRLWHHILSVKVKYDYMIFQILRRKSLKLPIDCTMLSSLQHGHPLHFAFFLFVIRSIFISTAWSWVMIVYSITPDILRVES